MARFKQYPPGTPTIDRRDYNARAAALEGLLSSLPGNSIMEGGRILTRRVPISSPGTSTFPARITANPATNQYTVSIQEGDGAGGLQDKTPTESVTAYEDNGREGIPTDTIVYLNYKDGDDNYHFEKDQGEAGTAATGVSYSHAEHADAANSGTWSRAAQSTGRGVVVTVQTGTRYDDAAGTPILYGYLRDLTFDADGHLVTVGAETRFIIDTPVVC